MTSSSELCTETILDFLAAAKAGDADRQRAHLTAPMREDRSFTPEAPFAIASWELAAPEEHGDLVVVRTTVRGVANGTEAPEMTTPFVLVQEDGVWRIDLQRSVGMQMTGDPNSGMAGIESALEGIATQMAQGLGQAMQGVATAIGDAFSNAQAEEFAARKVHFETETLPAARAQVCDRLRHEVAIEVDSESFAQEGIVLARIGDFLENTLATSIAMMREPARERLADGLARIVVRASANAAERGIGRRDDVLAIVLPKSGEEERLTFSVVARLLELGVETELAPRLAYAFERVGFWQDAWRESFGIEVPFTVDWLGFTRAWEVLANAWALHLLAEQGIDPLGDAFGAYLAADPAHLERVRAAVTSVRVVAATSPEERALELVDGELSYRVFVAEGHEGNWVAADLRYKMESDSIF